MSEPLYPAAVDVARASAGHGDWAHAYDVLSAADLDTPLDLPGLALLAEAAYAAGHPEETTAAWERAHALSLRSGHAIGAAGAAVRVALHLLIDTGLMAPVRGWVQRAERLLEGHDESPAHAWLAVVHSYERMLSGDAEAAGVWARRAIEIGGRQDPAAAAIGRVADARTVILSGDVRTGVALLNESAVAAVSGELDPISTGVVYCEVVCALQGVAQYDLAEEWTVAMERWHRGKPVGSIHGRCRIHRAEILRLRGSCLDAEREALSACEELRPYLRRELGWPLTELGRIRLRRGDIDGADDAFRQARELGWDPQPGTALVLLARGDAAAAAESIRAAVCHPTNVPSKELPPNTELRLAPLLQAQVEIELATGNVDAASAASDRLMGIAQAFDSRALLAGALLASGRVRLARNDAGTACRHLERAVGIWDAIAAPYESAEARMHLAEAYRALGNESQAIQASEAARNGFALAGASHRAGLMDATRAGSARATNGDSSTYDAPPAPVARRPASENTFRRAGDFWSVTFADRSAMIRDLKGMRYIARLLGAPGREFHALELVAGESETDVPFTDIAHAAGDVPLDARAKDAYRRRVAEIDADIEEAHSLGDDRRAAQGEEERDVIMRELARAIGLGGRDRRWGATSERARASVTRAIRKAMSSMAEHHPELHEHLHRAIRTGTYCAYLPDTRVDARWSL